MLSLHIALKETSLARTGGDKEKFEISVNIKKNSTTSLPMRMKSMTSKLEARDAREKNMLQQINNLMVVCRSNRHTNWWRHATSDKQNINPATDR
jgi:hypothetical protein